MPNEQIQKYIAENLQKGHSRDDIKTALLQAGWQESDIEIAFSFMESEAPQSESQPNQENASDSSEKKKKKAGGFSQQMFVIIAVLGIIFIVAGAFYLLFADEAPNGVNGEETETEEDVTEEDVSGFVPKLTLEDIKKFSSEQEFQKYLADAIEENLYAYDELASPQRGSAIGETPVPMPLEADFSSPAKDSVAERYSETNVQVEGIDEPDIVKTDGKNIYVSSERAYYYYYENRGTAETKIIQAFPIENLSLEGEIDKSGKLLLQDGTLVIFESDKILGYNVVDAENPRKEWEVGLDDKTTITSARLHENTIYLVTAYSAMGTGQPCIIEPLVINENPMRVECTEVYYPGRIVPIDAIYTTVKLDLKSGEEKGRVSFVGSEMNSVIYMSADNLYLSYFQSADIVYFMAGFFREKMADIVPEDVIQSLEKLNKYDISSQAKMVEMEIIIGKWMLYLTDDDALEIENELTNRLPDYYKENNRKMESTSIMKIGLSDLKIKASGAVPGTLLNQFAMDEHNGNLRVATTIGTSFQRWFFGVRSSGTDTVNDVYVLNEQLKQIGSVKDLGLGEKIYSVRFIGDKGYVVTFREIDPFYVLDLSNPANPEMKGELKIPGYSSYLHPLSEDKILGVGKEGMNVKISLFDVEDPYQPEEIDKYFLNEYWSEILNNHHAFLMDKKHEIFFLPGSRGGYIFSFENNKITLAKAISQDQVKRALYIDDYLYIVSPNKVVVLDQNTWETVKELDF